MSVSKFPYRTPEERKEYKNEGKSKSKRIIKATPKEIAKMKVMRERKESYPLIAKKTGFHINTVRKYLRGDVHLIPEVEKLAAEIRTKEMADLELLGGKLRNHLHTLVDKGDMKPIETIAGIDRTFQQRRLLEGKATQIFDIGNFISMEEELNFLLKELKNSNTPIETDYEIIKE